MPIDLFFSKSNLKSGVYRYRYYIHDIGGDCYSDTEVDGGKRKSRLLSLEPFVRSPLFFRCDHLVDNIFTTCKITILYKK